MTNVVVYSSRLSDAGGAEWMAISTAHIYANKGFSVKFLCQSIEDEEIYKSLIIKGISVHVLYGTPRFLLSLADKKNIYQKFLLQFLDLFNPVAFFNFLYLVKYYKNIDIIFFNKIRGASPLVFFAAIFGSKEIIYTAHDYEFFNYNAKKCKSNVFSVIYFYIFRYVFSIAIDKIIVPSFFVKSSIEKTYKTLQNKIYVIHNFVDSSCFDNRNIPMNSFDINICFIGRIENIKGIVQLLKSFEYLEDNYQLFVAGDGQLLNYLKAKYKNCNRISFLGKITPEQRNTLIRKCQISIIPSLWDEFFGLSAAESIALGTPILTSDRGALPEVLLIDGKFNGSSISEKTINCPKDFSFEISSLVKKNIQIDRIMLADILSSERYMNEISKIVNIV